MGVMKDDEYSESLAVAFLCAVAVALTYVCMYCTKKRNTRLSRSFFAFCVLLTRAFFHLSPKISNPKSQMLTSRSAHY